MIDWPTAIVLALAIIVTGGVLVTFINRNKP